MNHMLLEGTCSIICSDKVQNVNKQSMVQGVTVRIDSIEIDHGDTYYLQTLVSGIQYLNNVCL